MTKMECPVAAVGRRRAKFDQAGSQIDARNSPNRASAQGGAVAEADRRLLLCSSHNRLEELLQVLPALGLADAWWLFQRWWPDCDLTWQWRDWTLFWLKNMQPFAPHLLDENRALFESLPDKKTVLYRGCDATTVRNLSWTTDRGIAERFASGGRFGRYPNPVIATAVVSKVRVLAVNAERNESEVLIDPRWLRFSTDRLNGRTV